MSSSYTKTRIMVECALMIALGTILANIKIYELPNGGSITLFSMVPFILVSFRHGVKWGLFTGFVNSLLQMLLGFYAPPAPGLLPLVGMILLDYVLDAEVHLVPLNGGTEEEAEEEAVRLSTAAGAANVMCSGTQAAEREAVEALLPKVRFSRLRP